MSGIGTIAAARVYSLDCKQEPFVVVSMYRPLDEASPVSQDEMASWACRWIGSPDNLGLVRVHR